MNNKGFTLIELITTFCLCSIIIFLLINVVILMQEVYIKTDTRTKLLINQATLVNELNSKEIISWDSCSDSDFCFDLELSDGNVSRLIVEEDFIRLGNYTYKLDENTKIVSKELFLEKINYVDYYNKDSFLVIKITLQNKLLGKENFGVNFVQPYNSNL